MSNNYENPPLSIFYSLSEQFRQEYPTGVYPFDPIPCPAHSTDAGADIRLYIPLSKRKSFNLLLDEAYKIRTQIPLFDLDRYFGDFLNSSFDQTYDDRYLIFMPGQTILCHTAFHVHVQSHIPLHNAVFKIFPRSGLATKHNLTLANNVGIVDQDYRGEVRVALHLRSSSPTPFIIKQGDRIAQALVQLTYNMTNYTLLDTLDTSDRGTGGFGSTGSY